MRVLIVNTSENTGGAAVAAKRLMNALNSNGVKAKLLVAEKTSDNVSVASLPNRLRHSLHFLWERWSIFVHCWFSRKHLFEIDIANCGTDITRLREFKEADVIHLSWVNQGLLSLGGIRKILESGKPVVWTMHDLWPASSICHYARGCTRFQSGCHHCPLLPRGGGNHDLSFKVWRRKTKMLSGKSIHFVACSKWLAAEARKSGLLHDQYITDIPNPIDSHVYQAGDKMKARIAVGLPTDKKVILFVSQRVTDERKGMRYFVEALQKLVEQYPEMKENAVVAVLGGHAEEVTEQLPVQTVPLGYVSDVGRIVQIYQSADVYVLPSLEDNLPNTVMEAMACGVPCVGFAVGGIPEMIDHELNGYVARQRDAADLADGIHYVLSSTDYAVLRREALKKVALNYSQPHVAMKYIDVYEHALAQNNYRL